MASYHMLLELIMMLYYKNIETRRTFGAKFSNHSQKMGEPVEEYAAYLKRLYDKAHANRDKEIRCEDLFRRFLDGLVDDRTKFHVEYIKEPIDIDEAVYEVINFQETKRRQDEGMERRHRRPTRKLNVRQVIESEDENEDFSEDDKVLQERIARATPKPKKSQYIRKMHWNVNIQNNTEEKREDRNASTNNNNEQEAHGP